MSGEREIDGKLVELGEPLFFGEPVEPRQAKRGLRSLPLAPRKRSAKGVVTKADAGAVRRKLEGVLGRKPEVLVKISGNSTNMARLRPHLDYIARNGQIALEDQDGGQIEGKDALRDLRMEWQVGGFPIPEEGSTRQAFHLVLSMPAGTDPMRLKKAVRDFAAQEFDGFQYVMALHTEATDPDPKPSPHPHVHLTVKARGLDGLRLNPRKADLQRWREAFVTSLVSHGIEAVASRRPQRLSRTPGETQAVRQLKLRGGIPREQGVPSGDSARVAQAASTQRQALERYRKIAYTLASSNDPADQRLALEIGKRFGRSRGQPTPSVQPGTRSQSGRDLDPDREP